MWVLDDLKKDIKDDYKKVANYIFGNTTFDKVKDSYMKTKYNDENIYNQIVEKELKVYLYDGKKNIVKKHH
jgi:hypothetical protein